MTKARLVPNLIYSSILISAGLTGCGGDNNTDIPESITETVNDIVSEISNDEDDYVQVLEDGSTFIDSQQSSTTGVFAIFDPANGDIPLTSDALFVGSTDGTAALEDTTPPVTTALNDIDGFSTVGQIDIGFSGSLLESGNGSPKIATPTNSFSSPTLDGNAKPNIIILPLDTEDNDCFTGAPLSPQTITPDVVDSIAFGTQQIRADIETINIDNPDYSAETNPNVSATLSRTILRLSPQTPLQPKTKYLVAITKDLLAADSSETEASITYDILSEYEVVPKTTVNSECLVVAVENEFDLAATDKIVPQFQGLADLIVASEKIVKGTIDSARNLFYQGVFGENLPANEAMSVDDIIISFMFTTGGTSDVLTTMASSPAVADKPTPRSVDFSFSPAFDGGELLLAAGADPSTTFSHNMIQGAITLPYYLSTPNEAPGGFNSSLFSADLTIGPAPADCEVDEDSTEECPSPSYNVTYQFPYVSKVTDVTIPVLVAYPDLDTINPIRQGLGDPALTKPANGWPVVIFIPPIGGGADRTSVLSLSNSLANGCVSPLVPDCFATVVIDPPLHGITPQHGFSSLNVDISGNSLQPSGLSERHFGQYLGNVDLTSLGVGVVPAAQPLVYDNLLAEGTDEVMGANSSGSLFINILSFGNTRDNMRQYVMDLLNLNASLVNFDFEDNDSIGDLDTDRVYLLATSLGGSIGATFLAVNNNSSVQTSNGMGQDGTGSGNLPFIQAAAFNNIGGGLAKLLENSYAFGPAIVDGLEGFGISKGTENFEKFMYTLQNTLDSVDPINFASDLASTSTPILAQQIVGPDAAYLGGISGDFVIPNAADNDPVAPLTGGIVAPLAGTEPLYDALGLTLVTAVGGLGGSQVHFNQGSHSALLAPADDNPATTSINEAAVDIAVLTEMRSQIIGFFAQRGVQFAISNATVISSN